MSWGKLTLVVVVIYTLYYGVQIAIEMMNESKKKKPIVEGDDYVFEEESPVDVNEIDVIDSQEYESEETINNHHLDFIGNNQTNQLDASQKTFSEELSGGQINSDLTIHPIYGEPINMDEIKAQTNIISEAIFGEG